MISDGVDADAETNRDLGVRQALLDQLEHARLGRRDVSGMRRAPASTFHQSPILGAQGPELPRPSLVASMTGSLRRLIIRR